MKTPMPKSSLSAYCRRVSLSSGAGAAGALFPPASPSRRVPNTSNAAYILVMVLVLRGVTECSVEDDGVSIPRQPRFQVVFLLDATEELVALAMDERNAIENGLKSPQGTYEPF